MYGPQDAATTDQRANSAGRNHAAVHRRPPYDTIYDPQGAPIPLDEASRKVLDVFEDITSLLRDLLSEFEGVRHRLRTDTSHEFSHLGVSLKAKLTGSLSTVQTMADQLQHKIEPMQKLVVDLKGPKPDAHVHLSGVEMVKVLQLLAELRAMCETFARKLNELRSLTVEALEVTSRRFRRRTKTITIDCSAIVVILMFLLYVWTSKQFAKWRSGGV